MVCVCVCVCVCVYGVCVWSVMKGHEFKSEHTTFPMPHPPDDTVRVVFELCALLTGAPSAEALLNS